jgi:hypothetical protein
MLAHTEWRILNVELLQEGDHHRDFVAVPTLLGFRHHLTVIAFTPINDIMYMYWLKKQKGKLVSVLR